MPVARGIHRHAGGPRGVDPAVQHRNDFVSAFDGQRTAWAEVVLYVDDEEGIAGLQHFGGMAHAASPLPHDACGAWPPASPPRAGMKTARRKRLRAESFSRPDADSE